MNMPCFFCSMPRERVVTSYDYFYVVEDAFPVTLNHSLIISHDHDLTLDSMTREHELEMLSIIGEIKSKVRALDSAVTGFNIGINEGKDAGQTVMHFHCHVIPRREGDISDPRGGVRGVIPEKQKY